MKSENCYLCASAAYSLRPGKVRDNEALEIRECNSCGLVYLSSVAHITESHYENSGMHGDEIPNIQSWLNETEQDDDRRFRFLKDKITNKTILDFGCGVGGFLIKAKKITKQAEGLELESRLQAHFQKNEVLVHTDLKTLRSQNKKYDFITAFHVIEHLPDPIDTISQLSDLLAPQGEMIIEVPSSDDALLTLYECKSFTEFTYWSQHIYLFNQTTFSKMLSKTGLRLNWVKHIQRYPLSNHLYWLAKGSPGGHKFWNHLASEQLNQAYESALAANGLTDTLIASISLGR